MNAETTIKTSKLYARRETESLGELYIKHVEAMTAEGLHDKSAIAAELAHRDWIIDQQMIALDESIKALEPLYKNQSTSDCPCSGCEALRKITAARSPLAKAVSHV